MSSVQVFLDGDGQLDVCSAFALVHKLEEALFDLHEPNFKLVGGRAGEALERLVLLLGDIDV